VAAEFPAGEATGPELILDGGPCETGVESTVISLTGDRPAVLRLGGLAVEQIEAVVGPVTVAGSTSRPGSDPESASKAAGETANDAAPDSPPASPGMLDRHYAPSTRLAVVEAVTETVIERYLATADHPGAGASESAPADAAARSDPAGGAAPLGLLLFAERPELAGLIHDHGLAVEVLSERGEPREAAARLFAAMRSLDARGVRQIVAEWAPEHGLGRAINDRLKRAAR
jgi:L-threonylcarbamoyladenylate synthase